MSFSGLLARLLAASLSLSALAASVICLAPGQAHADDGAGGGVGSTVPPRRDLTEMSLEELANLQVTSVSKVPERLSHAAAAITVITQDDLRRSGVTSLAEALRLAPGLDVARMDSHTWAISSRGFNDAFANKLLVLMDGRSVYTPLFSGVYWDVQDTMLEDIDRIEVVRGPGATLWGANAVNGVINVITKSVRETQGGLFVAGGGSEELGFSSLRYGGQLGPNAFYRVYTKYFSRDSSVVPNGSTADDRWQMGRTGFRIDWDASRNDALTLQGDAYAGQLDQTYDFPTLTAPYQQEISRRLEVSGGNLLSRWHHTFSADSDTTLQMYYDRTRRDAPALIEEDRDTYDLDLQHHLALGDRHDLLAGAGYRLWADNIGGSFPVTFTRARRSSQLFSVFIQDSIALVPDRLQLTLGSKFEHNDFSGFESQPGGRVLWSINDRHSLWASVVRAVRTPSRAEADIRLNQNVIPGVPPTVVSVFGTGRFDSESLMAYEVGYRLQPTPHLSYDLALFYNQYDDIRSSEPGAFGPDPSLPGTPNVQRLELGNLTQGETYGGELSANWHMTEWWRWRASYTYLQMQLHRRAGSLDNGGADAERQSPHYQVALQSSLDLPWRLRLDGFLRYVDELADLRIKPYWGLDVRLAWEATKDLELSLVGQNLLDDRHAEFRPIIIPVQRTEVQRGVFGKITFWF